MTRPSFLAILRRNWWAAALGIIVTVLGTLGAYANTQPTYTADGSAFLVPAHAQADAQGNLLNPYTTFGSSSANLGLIVVEIANGNTVASAVQAQGGTASYTVSAASKAPIITVVATGHSSSSVARTVTAVILDMGTQLQTLQERAGVTLNKQIQVQPVKEPTKGKQTVSKRLILPAIVFVLGLLASAALALAIESLRGPAKPTSSRRRRGAGSPADTAEREASYRDQPAEAEPVADDVSVEEWSAAAQPLAYAPTGAAASAEDWHPNGNKSHQATKRLRRGLFDDLAADDDRTATETEQ